MEYGSQLLFLVIIVYIGQSIVYTSESTENTFKAGLLGMILVFLAQSSLRPYKSPFIRMRDRRCRVDARTGLLYIGLLVLILFQNISDARKNPVYLDPSYGKTSHSEAKIMIEIASLHLKTFTRL